MSRQTSNLKNYIRGFAVNILLCISSITIFTGSAEILARTWYNPQKIHDEGVFEYDRDKAFRLKKNVAGVFAGVPFTTNSFGYRNREISVAKPENTKRILVLGDSISFGHGVHDEETFSYLLEKSLNQHFSREEKKSAIEVINTAAPMNSPQQEYFDLKRGMQFEPDVIVLQLTPNDVSDMTIYNPVDTKQRIDRMFKQYSALYLFLKDMYSRARFRDPTGKNIAEKARRAEVVSATELITRPTDPRVLRAWNDALEWTQKIVDIAEEKDIPFILLVTPWDFQFGLERIHAYPQKTFRVFAEEQDLYYIDLLEILQKLFAEKVQETEEEEGEREEITEQFITETIRNYSDMRNAFWNALFIDYDHPSPTGHELIASVLEPYILHALTETEPNPTPSQEL